MVAMQTPRAETTKKETNGTKGDGSAGQEMFWDRDR